MKLELIGHDEKYAVEQSLLTLFPDERPIYGPVTDEDASAARITLTDRLVKGMDNKPLGKTF